MNKTVPKTKLPQNSKYKDNLKVATSSFKNQFSLSKLLVTAVLVVIILLGPIIMLSTRNLEEQQVRKTGSILNNLRDINSSGANIPEIKDLINQFKNQGSIDDGIKHLMNILDKNPEIAKHLLKTGISKEVLERMTISSLSFGSLAQVFSTAILYSLGWGIFSALKDKNMLDRNRVMYTNFSKHSVLFWKTFAETIMFIFTVCLADGLGMLLVNVVGKGSISIDLFRQLSVQLIAITVFYFFIQIGLRLIVSTIQSKSIKGVVLALWLLSTAFLYIVLSIVFGVKPETTDVIIDHKYIFIFMPIANIVVLPLVLYGSLPLWSIIPFIVYAFIGVILVWKRLTTAVKNYLCS